MDDDQEKAMSRMFTPPHPSATRREGIRHEKPPTNKVGQRLIKPWSVPYCRGLRDQSRGLTTINFGHDGYRMKFVCVLAINSAIIMRWRLSVDVFIEI